MSSAYSDEFKAEVVERFNGYFEASAGLTASAQQAGEDFCVATSTVLKWAEAAEQMPTPTWGEIRRLRAANAHLHVLAEARAKEIRALEDRLAEAGIER